MRTGRNCTFVSSEDRADIQFFHESALLSCGLEYESAPTYWEDGLTTNIGRIFVMGKINSIGGRKSIACEPAEKLWRRLIFSFSHDRLNKINLFVVREKVSCGISYITTRCKMQFLRVR